MRTLASLDSVLDQYDALLCDVWGVLHNGRQLYPKAAPALQRARQAGKAVILLTNVPKPRGPIPAQLDRIGCPRDAWDVIVTSGDATRFELGARTPGPVFKIGPEEFDRSLWEGLGLEKTTLDQARFVAISGLNREDETPEDYAGMLQQAKARDLEMVCANPDIVVRVGDRLVWCAGAIARDYAAIGGRVVMAGKPYPPIYQLAYSELETHCGRAIDTSRILCIGDGVPTDVAGANGQGLDCLFIASGMHGEALFTDGAIDPDKVDAALAKEGVRAKYVMPELR